MKKAFLCVALTLMTAMLVCHEVRLQRLASRPCIVCPLPNCAPAPAKCCPVSAVGCTCGECDCCVPCQVRAAR